MAGVAEALIDRGTDPNLKPELVELYQMTPKALSERWKDFSLNNGVTTQEAWARWFKRLPRRGEGDPNLENFMILQYYTGYILEGIIDGIDSRVRQLKRDD